MKNLIFFVLAFILFTHISGQDSSELTFAGRILIMSDAPGGPALILDESTDGNTTIHYVYDPEKKKFTPKSLQPLLRKPTKIPASYYDKWLFWHFKKNATVRRRKAR